MMSKTAKKEPKIRKKIVICEKIFITKDFINSKFL